MSRHQRPTHWICAIRPIGSGGRCTAGPQLHLPGSGARILVPKPAFCFEPAQGDSLGQQNTGHRAFMTSYRALPNGCLRLLMSLAACRPGRFKADAQNVSFTANCSCRGFNIVRGVPKRAFAVGGTPNVAGGVTPGGGVKAGHTACPR